MWIRKVGVSSTILGHAPLLKPEKKRAVSWEELVGDATGSAERVEGGMRVTVKVA